MLFTVDLRKLAEINLHLMIADRWDLLPKELLLYLENEIGSKPREDPVSVVFALIKLGVPPEKAIALLDWRKFEELCVRGFQMAGMQAVPRIRFFLRGKRYEIDVLGICGNLIVIADCKMWSRGRYPKVYKIIEAADAQLNRVKAFVHAIQLNEVSILEKVEGSSTVVPLLITWLDVGQRISKKGVAIVPIYMLPRFLGEIPHLLDELAHVTISYGIKLREKST